MFKVLSVMLVSFACLFSCAKFAQAHDKTMRRDHIVPRLNRIVIWGGRPRHTRGYEIGLRYAAAWDCPSHVCHPCLACGRRGVVTPSFLCPTCNDKDKDESADTNDTDVKQVNRRKPSLIRKQLNRILKRPNGRSVRRRLRDNSIRDRLDRIYKHLDAVERILGKDRKDAGERRLKTIPHVLINNSNVAKVIPGTRPKEPDDDWPAPSVP